MTSPILELRGLRKSFGTGLSRSGRQVHALAGIDLAIDPGETLGIVGESGCGKTTLARCALLLLEPSSGAVLFDGVDLLRLPAAELRARRREFQMVFQDPFASLDPRLTTGEILDEPFQVHRPANDSDRRERIAEILREVALDASILNRRPESLSGGQQQRIAIARALALRPRLLVADEPVSALDASVQAQILNLLADLRQHLGLTLLLISHSLPVVRYLCNRVAVMYLGRIVEIAPVEDFFRGPQHPYSEALLASVPTLEPGRSSKGPPLAGDPPSPASPPPGCPFHPRCPKAFQECRERRPELEIVNKTRVACLLASGQSMGVRG